MQLRLLSELDSVEYRFITGSSLHYLGSGNIASLPSWARKEWLRRDSKISKNELAGLTLNRRVAEQALSQKSRLLVDRLASSPTTLPIRELGVTALRMRVGTASEWTLTPMEKRVLLPTVAILPTCRNGMPGSLQLQSKMYLLPHPLLQQNRALLLRLSQPNSALSILLRSVASSG